MDPNEFFCPGTPPPWLLDTPSSNGFKNNFAGDGAASEDSSYRLEVIQARVGGQPLARQGISIRTEEQETPIPTLTHEELFSFAGCETFWASPLYGQRLNDLAGDDAEWVEPLYRQWVIQTREAAGEEVPIPRLTHEALMADTRDERTYKILIILGGILWVVIFGGLF